MLVAAAVELMVEVQAVQLLAVVARAVMLMLPAQMEQLTQAAAVVVLDLMVAH